MIRCIFILIVFLSFHTKAQTKRQLQIMMRLEMPNNKGENGGTVTLHQRNKNYYATIAGNKAYSLAVFNNLSELISPPDLAQLYDIRGLWYHPREQTFYANAFADTGWIKYTIDRDGTPYDAAVVYKGQRQPHSQSVGQYSIKENLVYFLKGCKVVAYDANTGIPAPEKNKILKVGFTRKNPPPAEWEADTVKTPYGYNFTTVIYTGIGQAEFGLLNAGKREIELYSASDGLMTTRLMIPERIPVREKLNFSFCNNMYWLFDSQLRSWIGLR
ncbi:MAG: hypothetical protein ACK55K_01090 [Bacteroidota bacterium]